MIFNSYGEVCFSDTDTMCMCRDCIHLPVDLYGEKLVRDILDSPTLTTIDPWIPPLYRSIVRPPNVSMLFWGDGGSTWYQDLGKRREDGSMWFNAGGQATFQISIKDFSRHILVREPAVNTNDWIIWKTARNHRHMSVHIKGRDPDTSEEWPVGDFLFVDDQYGNLTKDGKTYYLMTCVSRPSIPAYVDQAEVAEDLEIKNLLDRLV